MSSSDNHCEKCGANLALVGRVHRCADAASPVKVQVKVGRPRIGEQHLTVKAQKPWVALGMSQATWYRRRAEQRKS